MRRALLPLAAALAGALAGCAPEPEPLLAVAGGEVGRGRQLVHAFGCVACHTVPGESIAPADLGPPLTRFGERRFVAGALPNLPESLVLFLMDPQRVEPGTAMPDLGVSEREARHLAAFLYTLYDDPPPRPADPALVARARREERP